jgi:hypothetical protein
MPAAKIIAGPPEGKMGGRNKTACRIDSGFFATEAQSAQSPSLVVLDFGTESV